MNKFKIGILGLAAMLTINGICEARNGDDREHKRRHERRRNGGHGEKCGWHGGCGHFGDMGPGMHRCGLMFIVDEDALQKSIKDVWAKFKELRKFGRDTYLEEMSKCKKCEGKKPKGGKGPSPDPKKNQEWQKQRSEHMKQHGEQMSKKAADLGLTLQKIADLRNLSDLTLNEKLAINRIEGKLIVIELKKEGKACFGKSGSKSTETEERNIETKSTYIPPEPEPEKPETVSKEPEPEPEF